MEDMPGKGLAGVRRFRCRQNIKAWPEPAGQAIGIGFGQTGAPHFGGGVGVVV